MSYDRLYSSTGLLYRTVQNCYKILECQLQENDTSGPKVILLDGRTNEWTGTDKRINEQTDNRFKGVRLHTVLLCGDIVTELVVETHHNVQ